MTRRHYILPSRNLGDISAPTPTKGKKNDYQSRPPKTVTFSVYVQIRPAKKRGRMAFAEEAPVYKIVQFDAIGTMTPKYFSVDCISPTNQDGMTVTFPPITTSEARDLANTAQEIIDKQIVPRKCRPIGADILDIETLAT